jgi:hypothetical protein
VIEVCWHSVSFLGSKGCAKSIDSFAHGSIGNWRPLRGSLAEWRHRLVAQEPHRIAAAHSADRAASLRWQPVARTRGGGPPGSVLKWRETKQHESIRQARVDRRGWRAPYRCGPGVHGRQDRAADPGAAARAIPIGWGPIGGSQLLFRRGSDENAHTPYGSHLCGGYCAVRVRDHRYARSEFRGLPKRPVVGPGRQCVSTACRATAILRQRLVVGSRRQRVPTAGDST